jgi:hypothetical protein
MGGLTAVVIGLAAIVFLGAAGALWSHRAARHRPYLSRMYSVRRDTARDPLAPLRAGCAGIEIAVWLDDADRLQVGADRWNQDPGNAIGPLVLRPLARRAAEHGGALRPDHAGPVGLLIEIAESDPARIARACHVLDNELRAHPGLCTGIIDGVIVLGPVTVSLTGPNVPRDLLAGQSGRYVFRDGDFADIGAWGPSVALVPTVGERWGIRFGWDGSGNMPSDQRERLWQLVDAAHSDGRAVRFFGIPERSRDIREAIWREMLDAQVDMISTGHPRRLARFLGAYFAAVAPAPELPEPDPAAPAGGSADLDVRRKIALSGVSVRSDRRLGNDTGLPPSEILELRTATE